MAEPREIRVSFLTLVKIALVILLAAIIVKLWSVILMIVVATLIAVLLDPIVLWLEAHRVRRVFAIVGIACFVFGLLILFLVVLVPTVSSQIGEVSKELPNIVQRLVRAFPAAAPLIQAAEGKPGAATHDWVVRGLTAGKFALQGLSAVIFVLVLAIYLVVEGRMAFAWLISFAPASYRQRINRTAQEIRQVMLAYMRASVITASICGIYVFVVLSALGVPFALLLAVMAFLFDFIPVVGTIIMTVPATLLALLVSPGRALMVLGAYALYHVLEAYVLIPRIWGRELRVSTLTVLLAIAIGGTLLGVIGAVLALPIAAAYPIIERIWLRELLPVDTVPRHEALEES